MFINILDLIRPKSFVSHTPQSAASQVEHHRVENPRPCIFDLHHSFLIAYEYLVYHIFHYQGLHAFHPSDLDYVIRLDMVPPLPEFIPLC